MDRRELLKLSIAGTAVMVIPACHGLDAPRASSKVDGGSGSPLTDSGSDSPQADSGTDGGSGPGTKPNVLFIHADVQQQQIKQATAFASASRRGS